MPVMKVKPWGDGQGDFVLIDEDDFNPEVHEKLEDDQQAEPKRRGRKPKDQSA